MADWWKEQPFWWNNLSFIQDFTSRYFRLSPLYFSWFHSSFNQECIFQTQLNVLNEPAFGLNRFIIFFLILLKHWIKTRNLNIDILRTVLTTEMVSFLDDHTVLTTFSLDSLFPHDTSVYYRYHGSLTTPPCYESVIWTVFKNHIVISEEQVMMFILLQIDFWNWLS